MARQNRFRVSIIGARDIDRWLESMGADAARILNDAVKSGGEIALTAAKANAPVGATGRLQSNTTMTPVTRRRGSAATSRRITSASVKIGFPRIKKGDPNDAYYGPFVELGTKHQKPRFFLRDAVDRNKQRIADAITNRIARLRGR